MAKQSYLSHSITFVLQLSYRLRKVYVLPIITSLLAAACQLSAGTPLEPAVIVNPNGASRTELLRVVREVVHKPVSLADDALTVSNWLIIEPTRPRDPNGLLINGRELRKPDRFELFKQGGRCILTQVDSTHRWILTQTQCMPATIAYRPGLRNFNKN